MDPVWEGLWNMLITMVRGIYLVYKAGYDIFTELVTLNLLGEAEIQGYVEKIYMLVSVIMAFVVTYNLILMIIDPDKNQSGALVEKILKNIVKKLVILAIIPFAFTLLYDVQKSIMEYNVIEGIFAVGSNFEVCGEESPVKTEGAGSMASGVLFAAFFSSNEKEESKVMAKGDGWNHQKYETNSADTNNAISCRKNECSLKYAKACIARLGYLDVFDTFAMNIVKGEVTFHWLIALIAGFYACYVILNYAFDMGVRAVKLSALQILAPVAIAFSIDPDKEEVFKSWFKETKDTFLSAFFRIISLNLSIILMAEITKGFFDKDHNIGFMAGVIVLLALLTFMQQAPKLIEDVLGIKTDAKLGLFDKFKEFASPIMKGGRFARRAGAGVLGFVKGATTGKSLLAAIRAARTNYRHGNLSGIADEQRRRDEYERKKAEFGEKQTKKDMREAYLRKLLGLRSLEEVREVEKMQEGLQDLEAEQQQKEEENREAYAMAALNKRLTRFNAANAEREMLQQINAAKNIVEAKKNEIAAIRAKDPNNLTEDEKVLLKQAELYDTYYDEKGNAKQGLIDLEAKREEFIKAEGDLLDAIAFLNPELRNEYINKRKAANAARSANRSVSDKIKQIEAAKDIVLQNEGEVARIKAKDPNNRTEDEKVLLAQAELYEKYYDENGNSRKELEDLNSEQKGYNKIEQELETFKGKIAKFYGSIDMTNAHSQAEAIIRNFEEKSQQTLQDVRAAREVVLQNQRNINYIRGKSEKDRTEDEKALLKQAELYDTYYDRNGNAKQELIELEEQETQSKSAKALLQNREKFLDFAKVSYDRVTEEYRTAQSKFSSSSRSKLESARKSHSDYKSVELVYKQLKNKKQTGKLTKDEEAYLRRIEEDVVQVYSQYYEDDGRAKQALQDLILLEDDYKAKEEALITMRKEADVTSAQRIAVLEATPRNPGEYAVLEGKIKALQDEKQAIMDSVSVSKQTIDNIASRRDLAEAEAMKPDSGIKIGLKAEIKLDDNTKIELPGRPISSINQIQSVLDDTSGRYNVTAKDRQMLEEAQQKLRDSGRIASYGEDRKSTEAFEKMLIENNISREAINSCINSSDEIDYNKLAAINGTTTVTEEAKHKFVKAYLETEDREENRKRLEYFIGERMIIAVRDKNIVMVDTADKRAAECDNQISLSNEAASTYKLQQAAAKGSERVRSAAAATGYVANRNMLGGGGSSGGGGGSTQE